MHRADWVRPPAAAVADALSEAFTGAAARREAVRENATAWDINTIIRDHWEPALAELA